MSALSSPKTVALAALRRAQEEAARVDGSMLVLGALLTDAVRAVVEIAELQRVRRPKVAKESTA